MKRLISGFLLFVLVIAILTAQPLAVWYQMPAAVSTRPVHNHEAFAGGSGLIELVLTDPPIAVAKYIPAGKTIVLPQPSPQPSPKPLAAQKKSYTAVQPVNREIDLSVQETFDLLPSTEASSTVKTARIEGGTIKVTQATTAKPAPTPRPTPRSTSANQTAATEADSDSQPEPAASPRKIDPKKPMVCLTYDDGPTSGVTSVVLDVLKANKAAATFFVIGQSAAGQKSLLRRMVTEGHEIGNHTYNHKSLIRISGEEGRRQISLTQQAVKDAAGVIPRLFRPPYNELSSSVLAYIPLPVIRWSVDEKDWNGKTASQIASSNLQKIKDGDIVLLHDVKYATAEASKTIIPELVRRGYQLVTVSEMFEARGITLKPAAIYRSAYP